MANTFAFFCFTNVPDPKSSSPKVKMALARSLFILLCEQV